MANETHGAITVWMYSGGGGSGGGGRMDCGLRELNTHLSLWMLDSLVHGQFSTQRISVDSTSLGNRNDLHSFGTQFSNLP